MVHLRLAETGHATSDIAWAGQPGLALPEAWEKGMDDALDAAVADTPNTAPCAPCSPDTRPLVSVDAHRPPGPANQEGMMFLRPRSGLA